MLRPAHLFKFGIFVLVASILVGGLAFAATDTTPTEAALSEGGSDSTVAATNNANAVTASSNCNVSDPSLTAKWQGLDSVVNALMSPISNAQSTINTSANMMAGKVTGVAGSLGGILAISYLMWKTIQSVAGSGEPMSAIMVESLIPAGIVGVVLTQYSTLIGGFQGLFSSLVSALTGGGTLSNALTSFAQSLFTSLGSAFNSAATGLACITVWKATLSNVLDSFFTLLLMIVAACIGFIALAEVVGVLLTGIVLVGIGIGVGPVFIACGVCKWSEGFMHSWLRFLLGGMSYTMLVSVVLSLLSGALTNASTTLSSQGGTAPGATSSTGSGLHIGVALGFVGLMWVLKHVFASVPSIAKELVGGGSSGGGSSKMNGGFSGGSKAMKDAAAAMTGAAAVMGLMAGKAMKSLDEGGEGAGQGDTAASVENESATAFAGDSQASPSEAPMLSSSASGYGGGGADTFDGGGPRFGGPDDGSPSGGNDNTPSWSDVSNDGTHWEVP